MIRACIFDLDGTLTDTLDDLADSMNTVLASRGHPTHPTTAYRHFVGDGIELLAQRALPAAVATPDEVVACVARMREVYGENWRARTRPYDGVPALLCALERRGLLLAVLSNKPDAMTQRVVAHFFPAVRFAGVAGMQEGVPRKPDPAGALRLCAALGVAPAEVLYLGDTDTDMRTAVAAGMFPVGALWGFRDAAELRANGARALCAHPREVLDCVTRAPSEA